MLAGRWMISDTARGLARSLHSMGARVAISCEGTPKPLAASLLRAYWRCVRLSDELLRDDVQRENGNLASCVEISGRRVVAQVLDTAMVKLFAERGHDERWQCVRHRSDLTRRRIAFHQLLRFLKTSLAFAHDPLRHNFRSLLRLCLLVLLVVDSTLLSLGGLVFTPLWRRAFLPTTRPPLQQETRLSTVIVWANFRERVLSAVSTSCRMCVIAKRPGCLRRLAHAAIGICLGGRTRQKPGSQIRDIFPWTLLSIVCFPTRISSPAKRPL